MHKRKIRDDISYGVLYRAFGDLMTLQFSGDVGLGHSCEYFVIKYISHNITRISELYFTVIPIFQ